MILREGIEKGWCRVQADNVWVYGHTIEETVEGWRKTLEVLDRNNIKLGAHKTQCFPEVLDLLGWKKRVTHSSQTPTGRIH